VEAAGVGPAGGLLLLSPVTEAQLDELDAERGREPERTGDGVCRVDVVGPCHAVVELGEQTELHAGRGQSVSEIVGTAAT
jgi:hypothetical protein